MIRELINEFNKKQEILDIYKKSVEAFKEKYDIELEKLNKRKSLEQRAESIQNNFFYKNIFAICYVMVVSLLVEAILTGVFLFTDFFVFRILFRILFLVTTGFGIFVIALLHSYKKEAFSNAELNKELRELRVGIWKDVLSEKAKAKGYGLERYEKYLLEYHDKDPNRSIMVAIASMAYTIVVTLLVRNITTSDIVTLIAMAVFNVVTNFLGNIFSSSLVYDYYYESLKNEVLLD